MRGAPQLGQKPRRSPEAPTVGATEGDQLLGVTRLAVHPQKAMVQPTTFEVILELALHIAEQFTALLLPDARLRRRVGHRLRDRDR